MVFMIFNFAQYINVPGSVQYARKCILYGFPSEMDFSPLIPASHTRRKRSSGIRRLVVGKFISNGKPYFMHIMFDQVLKPEERTRLAENIGGHLKDALEMIQKRAVRNFSQADPEYGRRIQEVLDKHRQVT